MDERDEVGDRPALGTEIVLRIGRRQRVAEGRFHLREEVKEGGVEALVPIIGEEELAEGAEEIAVALQPERVALVEGEDEGGRHHRPRHAGHALDHADEAFVVADRAVAIGVIAQLVEVEDELDVVRLDLGERCLGRAEIGHEGGKQAAEIREGDRLRIGVLGHRQAHDRNQERGRRLQAVAVEALREMLDGAHETDRAEAEPGFVVHRILGEDRGELGLAGGKAACLEMACREPGGCLVRGGGRGKGQRKSRSRQGEPGSFIEIIRCLLMGTPSPSRMATGPERAAW